MHVNFNISAKIPFNSILLLIYTPIKWFTYNGDNNCHYHASCNNKFCHQLPYSLTSNILCSIMLQCEWYLQQQLHLNLEITISKHKPWVTESQSFLSQALFQHVLVSTSLSTDASNQEVANLPLNFMEPRFFMNTHCPQ